MEHWLLRNWHHLAISILAEGGPFKESLSTWHMVVSLLGDSGLPPIRCEQARMYTYIVSSFLRLYSLHFNTDLSMIGLLEEFVCL